jgi:hypothetical protein
LDDDGTIDIKDVSAVARLYGTTGDSTKNVTINHNSYEWSSGSVQLLPGQNWVSPVLDTSRYGEFTVHLQCNNGRAEFTGVRMYPTFQEGFNIGSMQNEWKTVTYPVTSSRMYFYAYSTGDTQANILVELYFTTAVHTQQNTNQTINHNAYNWASGEVVIHSGGYWESQSFDTSGFGEVTVSVNCYSNGTTSIYGYRNYQMSGESFSIGSFQGYGNKVVTYPVTSSNMFFYAFTAVDTESILYLDLYFTTAVHTQQNTNQTINHNAYNWASGSVQISPDQSWGSETFETLGYGEVTVSISCNGTLDINGIQWYGVTAQSFSIGSFQRYGGSKVATYPVTSPRMSFYANNPSDTETTLHLDLYFTTAVHVNAEKEYDSGNCVRYNFTWNGENAGGVFIDTIPTYGFSKLFMTLQVTGVSRQGWWGGNSCFLQLGSLHWFDPLWGGYDFWEYPPSDVLNYTKYSGDIYSAICSQKIDVKGPSLEGYLWLDDLQDIAPSGWMTIAVYYYTRNE